MSNFVCNLRTLKELSELVPKTLYKSFIDKLAKSEYENLVYSEIDVFFKNLIENFYNKRGGVVLENLEACTNTLYEIFICIWAGERLHRIMSMNTRKNNVFQPSKNQITQLDDVFGDFWRTLSNKKRQSFLSREIMFPHDTSGDIYRDHCERAKSLVKEFRIHPIKKNLMTLVGHGQLVFCFLELFFQEFKDREIQLVIVDIDKDVDKWHRTFFGSVENTIVANNIFNLSDVFFNLNVLKTSTIYYNFCGLGGSNVNSHTFLSKVAEEVGWIRNIPIMSLIRMRFGFGLERLSKSSLVGYSQLSELEVDKSLRSALSRFGNWPLSTTPIVELLQTLIQEIPVENFSIPLVLIVWCEKFNQLGIDHSILISYSTARNYGKHKSLLTEYLLSCGSKLLTDRNDFESYKLGNNQIDQIDQIIKGSAPTPVSVNMTGIKGWENYNHCFLDGKVVKVQGSGANKRFTVKLDQFTTTYKVTVPASAIQHQREATKNAVWKAGDKVQIWEEHNTTEGWWEATVVDVNAQRLRVRWKGQYEEKSEEEVDAAKTRTAIYQLECDPLNKRKAVGKGGKVPNKKRKTHSSEEDEEEDSLTFKDMMQYLVNKGYDFGEFNDKDSRRFAFINNYSEKVVQKNFHTSRVNILKELIKF